MSKIIKEMNRHEACLAYIFGSSDVTFIIWRKLYRKEILDKVNFPKDMLPEDMVKDNQDKIQKLTDKYVGIIDAQVVEKEKEVMTV